MAFFFFFGESCVAGPELGLFVHWLHNRDLLDDLDIRGTGQTGVIKTYSLPSPTLPYTLYVIPLKGRRRTERQKAHNVVMRKRRWLPKSHTETEAIDPVNHRLLSRARVEYKREMKMLKKSDYNARRRGGPAGECGPRSPMWRSLTLAFDSRVITSAIVRTGF